MRKALILLAALLPALLSFETASATAYSAAQIATATYANAAILGGSASFPGSNIYMMKTQAPGEIYRVTLGGVKTTIAGLGNVNAVDIAFGPSGDLFVPINSSTNPAVYRITAAGSVSQYATYTASNGYPRALAFDNSFNAYIPEAYENRVMRITPGGSVSALSGFSFPYDVATDASGNAYVTNNTGNTVSKITSGGSVTTVASGIASPTTIAIDSSGNVYVASQGAVQSATYKITPAGAVSVLPSPGSVTAFAFDGAGNVIAAGAAAIYEITPAGVITQIAAIGGARSLMFDQSGNLYAITYGDNGVVYKLTPIPLPACTLTPPSQSITFGQPAVLNYTISGSASSATINGVPVPISASGQYSPVPGFNTTYTMTVTNIGGSVQCGPANVTVEGGASIAGIALTSGSLWQVPANWNNASNTIEAIGGGGSGAGGGGTRVNGGGGGGAYSKVSNVSLTPGSIVAYSVGAGGSAVGTTNTSGVPGGDSYFMSASCASSVVCAKGGAGGTMFFAGPGGVAANGVGTIKYSGGAGGRPISGGGGGAGGPRGAGVAANANTNRGGNGGAGFGGAGGSIAGNPGQPGGNGTEWGGAGSGGGGVGGSVGAGPTYLLGGSGGNFGGGGGSSPSSSQSGGQGVIIITYTPLVAPACSLVVTPSVVNGGTSATLSWAASNSNTFFIDGVGYVNTPGSTIVTPSNTTTYFGTVTGPGGEANCAATLTVNQPCVLPWGGNIPHSSSTSAYEASEVPYGGSCVSQTRFCTDGSFSGSYEYQSCSVLPAVSCTLDGVTVSDGDSETFYSQQTNPVDQTCSSVSQSRTCTNGTLSGSAAYQYGSCSCAPLYFCSAETIMYSDNTCASVEIAVCAAPSFCSPGQSSCQNLTPEFVSFGSGRSGHLQVGSRVVPNGTATRVYWNVANVQNCSVQGSNGDSWSALASGDIGQLSSAILQPTTYTLSCVAHEGQTFVAESVTVNLVPIFRER